MVEIAAWFGKAPGWGWWALPIWVLRSEVVAVRRVRWLFGYGVRFETVDGAYDGVLFWTRPSRAIFEGLEALGWPVPRG